MVHTYSGYENKVKANIDKTIENRHLEDQILEVRVPLEEVLEQKNGVQKVSMKKLFPGYVRGIAIPPIPQGGNEKWQKK